MNNLVGQGSRQPMGTNGKPKNPPNITQPSSLFAIRGALFVYWNLLSLDRGEKGLLSTSNAHILQLYPFPLLLYFSQAVTSSITYN